MPIIIQHANVLDVPADALILTVDGAARGMEGNIARQFQRRYPDDWLDVQREIRYPIPLGRAVGVPWDGDCPWRLLLIASTLHHAGVLDDAQKLGVTRAACAEALEIAARHGVRTVASAVMKGGWRLGLEEGFRAMGNAYMASAVQVRGIDFRICAATKDEATSLTEITAQSGWG